MPTWWEVSNSVENFKVTWVQFPILCIRKVRILISSSSVSFAYSLSKCLVNTGAVSENMDWEITWVIEQKKDRTNWLSGFTSRSIQANETFFGNGSLCCSKNTPNWAWLYSLLVWLWRQSRIVEFFRTFVNIGYHSPGRALKFHLQIVLLGKLKSGS